MWAGQGPAQYLSFKLVISGFWNLSEAAPVDISQSQMLEGLLPEFSWNANVLI
jgi:hypothetical protein